MFIHINRIVCGNETIVLLEHSSLLVQLCNSYWLKQILYTQECLAQVHELYTFNVCGQVTKAMMQELLPRTFTLSLLSLSLPSLVKHLTLSVERVGCFAMLMT